MSVEEIADSLESGGVYLVLVDTDNFRDCANGLAGRLLSRGMDGIYITTDRSFDQIREDIEYEGFDTADLYFVDAVSRSRGMDHGREGVKMINSPTAFNDINLALSDLFEEAEGDTFLVLDSFTAWLLYGDLKPLGNFVKKLTDKARDHDTATVILAVKDQLGEDAVETFMSFCDGKFDLAD